jgi:hypothetical protein
VRTVSGSPREERRRQMRATIPDMSISAMRSLLAEVRERVDQRQVVYTTTEKLSSGHTMEEFARVYVQAQTANRAKKKRQSNMEKRKR